MPRHKSLPKYACHRLSGQARTIINGRQIYLGKFGSPESKAAYARIIAERVSADRVVVEPSPNGVAVVLMRPGDIDMPGETWLYEQSDHKNRWQCPCLAVGHTFSRIPVTIAGLDLLADPHSAANCRAMLARLAP